MTLALRAFAASRPLAAASDRRVSPTYVPDLAHATLDLLLDEATGIWHLANQGAVTWAEFARLAASAAGIAPATLEERPGDTLQFPAPRPRSSVLGSERGLLLPPLTDALERYVRHQEVGWQEQAPVTDVPAGRTACPAREEAPGPAARHTS